MSVCVRFVPHICYISCSNASYGVYTYYNGSLNGMDSNVYYLMNFDDLLRSYGECVCMCVRGNDSRRYIGSERAWEGGSNRENK